MPSYPRSQIVVTGEVGLYHCVSRCVRRAFLCGADPTTGKSFEHRKDWVESRLAKLARAMAVDVCGFAVMSNHLHLVLRTRPDLATAWSAEEIVRRWWRLYPGRRNADGRPAAMTPEELAARTCDAEQVETLRTRLADLSWFMRGLSEPIARRANREDNCTGRFWEGRFKSQALLDEAAVLACTMYVDLNPIRAGVAQTPETSCHTSAFRRIEARQRRRRRRRLAKANVHVAPPAVGASASWLCRLSLAKGGEASLDPALQRPGKKGFLDMALSEYLRLLDWTGRQLRRKKRGSIPARLAPILERLRVDEDAWLTTVEHFGRTFHRAAGRVESLVAKAASAGVRWLAGLSQSRAAFGPSPAGRRGIPSSLKRRRISVCDCIPTELQSSELARTHGNSYRLRC